MNKYVHLSSLDRNKETILMFSVIFGIYSNSNRQALTLHKCVHNETSARVSIKIDYVSLIT